MVYGSRRLVRTPFLSVIDKRNLLQFALEHKNWTVEHFQKVTWKEESRFHHADGSFKVTSADTQLTMSKVFVLKVTKPVFVMTHLFLQKEILKRFVLLHCNTPEDSDWENPRNFLVNIRISIQMTTQIFRVRRREVYSHYLFVLLSVGSF